MRFRTVYAFLILSEYNSVTSQFLNVKLASCTSKVRILTDIKEQFFQQNVSI
jgi:hypothetical protein